MKYINIHTHSHLPDKEVISIINGNVIDIIEADFYYSQGIHPWNINKVDIEHSLEKLNQIAGNANVLAIGECGLDKLIDLDIQLQEEIFKRQIQIAEKVHKPIIIHCVKCFDELIRIKKEMKISVPLIVHGFNNNMQIAEQLIKNGFYISLGIALLNDDSNASKIISTIPIEKLFLETDDKDVSIKSIFEIASTRLKINLEALQKNIYSNFKKIFNSRLRSFSTGSN